MLHDMLIPNSHPSGIYSCLAVDGWSGRAGVGAGLERTGGACLRTAVESEDAALQRKAAEMRQQ